MRRDRELIRSGCSEKALKNSMEHLRFLRIMVNENMAGNTNWKGARGIDIWEKTLKEHILSTTHLLRAKYLNLFESINSPWYTNCKLLNSSGKHDHDFDILCGILTESPLTIDQISLAMTELMQHLKKQGHVRITRKVYE